MRKAEVCEAHQKDFEAQRLYEELMREGDDEVRPRAMLKLAMAAESLGHLERVEVPRVSRQPEPSRSKSPAAS